MSPLVLSFKTKSSVAYLTQGFSKSLIHKYIVPCNYQPIQSDHDLCILSLSGTTTSTNLVMLTKICFTEFNQNIVINEHFALIVDSNSIKYNIIFVADFLNKCSFHLDNDHIFVGWTEYIFSATHLIFITTISYLISPHLTWNRNTIHLAMPTLNLTQLESLMPNIYRQTSMAPPLDNNTSYWISNMICLMFYWNIKNCFMDPLEIILTKCFTLNLNQEPSHSITLFTLFCT